ncbi:MAG: tRNA pseudouridine(38-40) synthase TruA [Thermoplasmata archaeon]
MRYALKFAYDGPRFGGYARQPGKTTVEGEIIMAMKGLGVIEDARSANFRSASRTDRGVSAAGNVLAVDTDFSCKALPDALNSKLDGIVFHGIARVPDDFNPRHARQRHYRYFLAAKDAPPVEKLRKAAKPFIGKHDFRLFSKKDTGRENTVLTIDSVDIMKMGNFIIIDIRGQRFLWEVVRRMLSAMVDVARGKLTQKIVKGMLAGTEKKPGGIKPMVPEYLVLMEVEYDFDFQKVGGKWLYFENEIYKARRRGDFLTEIVNVISME